MQIECVSDVNLSDAAKVHAASWRASHRGICSEAFIAEHTTERQMDYIQSSMREGKRFYLLRDDVPVAVVAVKKNVISNLYVHPANQRKGYGTMILAHAMTECEGSPVLWVLNTNQEAQRLYERIGFVKTGQVKLLNNNLYEIEMQYTKG